MKQIFIFTALLGLAVSASAQFHEVIGGTTNSEGGRDLINTSDGGHLFVGIAQGISSGDVLVVKTNSSGTVSWQKNFGNATDIEHGLCVVEVSDGYVIGGTTVSGGTQSAYTFKINLTGTTVNWSRKWSSTSIVNDVCLSSDGHPVFIGSYGTNILATKMDKTTGANTGGSAWTKTYDLTSADAGYGITLTSDGGFGVCGQVDHLGTAKLLVMKINSAGTFSSASFHSCLSYHAGTSIAEASDGGLVVVGMATDLVGDAKQYIVKTNSTTSFLWSKLYGYAGKSYEGTGIIKTSDGGYITSSNGGFLLKMNSSGIVTWTKRLHGYLGEVVQTSTGDYVTGGESTTLVGPLPDLYMVKTTSGGDCCAELPNLYTTYTHTTSSSGIGQSTPGTPSTSAFTTSIGTPTFTTTSNCTLCPVDAGPNVNNHSYDACCTPASVCTNAAIGSTDLGYIYSWTPTTNVANPSASSTTANPCGTTVYALEASDPSDPAGCLVNVDLVQVTTIWHICCGSGHFTKPGGTPGTTVFPNPTKGMFTIALEDVEDTDAVVEIKITDAAGRQVFYEKSTAANATYEIDISAESKGIYIITVAVGESISTEKIEVE